MRIIIYQVASALKSHAQIKTDDNSGLGFLDPRLETQYGQSIIMVLNLCVQLEVKA